MQTPQERWSAVLVLVFLAVTIFLTFHLYLRPSDKPKEGAVSRTVTRTAPEVSIINPTKGAAGAKVTIVEFGDFECPACADTSTILEGLVDEFDSEVRLVWKDFPNENLHPSSTSAAIAGRCAQSQGAFWQYHDLLFTQRERLNDTTYRAIAQTLKLDVEAFDHCRETRATLPRIQKDFEEGLALSLSATPTIFVNNERFVGTPDKEALRTFVAKLLETPL